VSNNFNNQRIKMKNPAYIFMEFQKDFLSPTGKLNIIKNDNVSFLNNAKNILNFARENEQTIIHVHLSFSTNYAEIKSDIKGILGVVKQAGAFQKGSSGIQAIDEFTPQGNEICIYKNSISAFKRTNLEEQLKKMNIKNLVFTGMLSHVCIESSVRDAYEAGYDISVIHDATSTLDEKCHQHAVNQVLPLFSTLCSTEEYFSKTQF
jgi:nicotinamidase-related amidase